MRERQLLCPSASAAPEAIVLGIRQQDGTVAYLGGGLTASAEFVEAVSERAAADFRFAAPCAQGGCGHWRADAPAQEGDQTDARAEAGQAAGHCSLVGRLRAVVTEQYQSEELPQCGIRQSCRWFAQDGRAACLICPVVTKASGATASAESRLEGVVP